MHQLALVRLAGHDGALTRHFGQYTVSGVRQVQAQAGLAHLGIRSMAAEAILGQDGAYIAVEFQSRRRRPPFVRTATGADRSHSDAPIATIATAVTAFMFPALLRARAPESPRSA